MACIKLNIVIYILLFFGTTGFSQSTSEFSLLDSALNKLANNEDLELKFEDVIGFWDRSDFGFSTSTIKFRENGKFTSKNSGCFGTHSSNRGTWKTAKSTLILSAKRKNYELMFYKDSKNDLRLISPDQIDEIKILLDDHIIQGSLTPKLEKELVNSLISNGWDKKQIP